MEFEKQILTLNVITDLLVICKNLGYKTIKEALFVVDSVDPNKTTYIPLAVEFLTICQNDGHEFIDEALWCIESVRRTKRTEKVCA